jgi:hypothetical protein
VFSAKADKGFRGKHAIIQLAQLYGMPPSGTELEAEEAATTVVVAAPAGTAETTAIPVASRTSPTTILAIRMNSSGMSSFNIGLCTWRHSQPTVTVTRATTMAAIQRQNERAHNSGYSPIMVEEKKNQGVFTAAENEQAGYTNGAAQ